MIKYSTIQKSLVVTLLFYFFFYPIVMFSTGIGGKMVYVILLFAMGLALVCILMRARLPHRALVFMWLIVFLGFLVRNHALQRGSYLWPLVFSTLIISFVALSENISWIYAYEKAIISFGWIFLAATYILFVFQGLYPSVFQLLGYDKVASLGSGTLGYESGLTDHYSANGIYLAAFTLITGCLYICSAQMTAGGTAQTKIQRKQRRYYLLAMVLGFGGILLTTKRAHLIFSIAALMLTFFVCSPNRKFSKITKILGMTIALLTVFWILSFFIPAFGAVLARFNNVEDISNGRFAFWGKAMTQFQSHPIFGTGWYGYRYTIGWNPLTGGYTDAHNVYIQLLYEGGIAGFIFTFSTMVFNYGLALVIFKKYRAQLSYQQFCALTISFCVQTFALIYDLTGNGLYDRMVFMYLLACCTTVGVYSELKRNKHRVHTEVV